MGDLDAILRDVIGVANDVTLDLQVAITQRRVTARDSYLKPTAFTDTPRTAFVGDIRRQLRTAPKGTSVEATESQARTVYSMLGNIAVDVLSDVFILPDGTTSPTLQVDGFADPAGGRFFTIVTLGSTTAGGTQ